MVVSGLIFSIFGCASDTADKKTSRKDKPLTFEQIEKSDITDFINSETLYDAGLEKVWENDLAIAKKEYLESISIEGGYLYALSNRNFLFSLNRNKGNILFSKEITQPGLPVLGFRKHEENVMTVAGNRLMVVSPITGEVKETFSEDYTISCLPARNGGYYYIGATDGILRAVGVKDKIGIHNITGRYNSEIVSVFFHKTYGVIFATKAGNIVFANNVLLSKLWDFTVSEGLSVPVSIKGDYLYAIADDSKLYKISLANGSLQWKTPVGLPEDKKPVVGNRNVYQLTEDKEVIAVDKNSGKIVWKLENAKGALNEINGKSYIASNGGLKIIDSATGEIKRELILDKNCIYGVNLDDELVYIADRVGNICCVKPIK